MEQFCYKIPLAVTRWYVFVPPGGTLLLRRLHTEGAVSQCDGMSARIVRKLLPFGLIYNIISNILGS